MRGTRGTRDCFPHCAPTSEKFVGVCDARELEVVGALLRHVHSIGDGSGKGVGANGNAARFFCARLHTLWSALGWRMPGHCNGRPTTVRRCCRSPATHTCGITRCTAGVADEPQARQTMTSSCAGLRLGCLRLRLACLTTQTARLWGACARAARPARRAAPLA